MSIFNIRNRTVESFDILELSGELDAHTASHLEESLKSLIAVSRIRIIVNCRHLEYISSAGLGVFMAYIEDVRQLGGDIKLTNMTSKVYNVFDLLGFPTLYDILDEETQAYDKFNSVA
jgi:anti-sigma B factor antagonist